jgi:transcriptional regulator with XRE-family HTH domain
VSIGEALTAARERAGLTVTQVGQRTRIRETIIRGIERDDFSACGGDFYARGHIRAIARATGADPEPLVREYDSSYGPPPASAAAGMAGSPAPLRLRTHRGPNWSVTLLVLLAAAVGLISYHLVASHSAGSTSAGGRPAAAHKSASRHPRAPSTPAPRTATRHVSPDVVIVLTAVSEACWADLTTPAGATIFQGVLNPGTSMHWTEREVVSLRLGNPGGVTLTVNGQPRTGLGLDPVTLSLAPGSQPSG